MKRSRATHKLKYKDNVDDRVKDALKNIKPGTAKRMRDFPLAQAFGWEPPIEK